MSNTNDQQHSANPRPTFLDALLRYRKRAAFVVIGSLIFFELLTVVLPTKYESVATVLPPEQHGTGGMLSTLLSNSIASSLLSGQTINPDLQLFKTIVESKAIATTVARDTSIQRYFLTMDTSHDFAINALQSSVTGEALRTGVFTITVDLPTGYFPSSSEKQHARKLSAYVASKFVTALDEFNRNRSMSSAHATRVFMEGEYDQRMAQLDSAYARMQAFQEKNQAIALPEQLSTTVKAAATLSAQIQQLEVERDVEQRDLSPNSERIKTLNTQIEAAREQLAKFDDGGAGQYVIALKSVPELARQFASQMRELKVLETITGFLRQQVEQERIAEQRDLPTLQVLDPAHVPTSVHFPNRTIFTLIGFAVGLVLAFLYLRWRLLSDDMRVNPERHKKIITFFQIIRGSQSRLQPQQLPRDAT